MQKYKGTWKRSGVSARKGIILGIYVAEKRLGNLHGRGGIIEKEARKSESSDASRNEVKISIRHALLVTRLAYFIGPMRKWKGAIQSERPSKNGSAAQSCIKNEYHEPFIRRAFVYIRQ